ncbi:sodium ABC transporter ATP-binding protein [Niallia circulans]|uniref:ABC transporter ATP-binding protein n=1 Tax=Niallia circulans TaxID=1397 RepID=UPI000BA75B60|nr:ABC transporter ATP-binding protein [Niallia circulans]PAD27670.1 sodium ABC transporter ATP-binding protein [Niallia circulans]
MENTLELINVSKNRQGFSLDTINITLKKGFIMGFIGPNGAGKSTTIKLIMNLIKKDSGMIKVFGLDNEKHSMKIKERIGFVYDDNHFYEELTIKEMKNIIRPFYSQWEESTFNKYVKDFSLPMDKKINELSKGMKMKFSLAIALSHQAELLIMDEPTSGLDPLVRTELLDVLQTLIQDENKAIFFSTHITSDLDKIADYITLINNGQIILSKTKDELLEEYTMVKGKDSTQIIHNKNLISLKSNDFGFEALCKNKEEVRKQFGTSYIYEKPTLEDIMVFYTRRSGGHVSSN